MRVQFTIPGEPKGKQRPRVVTRGGFSKAYTPEQTLTYENMVRWCYKEQSGEMFDGELAVGIEAVFQIPKSVSKKKRQQMLDKEIRPTKKPDADNIAKIICDALNGIAYHDDSAVVDLRVRKYWGDVPGVTVTIMNAPNEAIPFIPDGLGGFYGE